MGARVSPPGIFRDDRDGDFESAEGGLAGDGDVIRHGQRGGIGVARGFLEMRGVDRVCSDHVLV